jgi:hypothetical protein
MISRYHRTTKYQLIAQRNRILLKRQARWSFREIRSYNRYQRRHVHRSCRRCRRRMKGRWQWCMTHNRRKHSRHSVIIRCNGQRRSPSLRGRWSYGVFPFCLRLLWRLQAARSYGNSSRVWSFGRCCRLQFVYRQTAIACNRLSTRSGYNGTEQWTIRDCWIPKGLMQLVYSWIRSLQW